jgi:hypothetical protein
MEIPQSLYLDQEYSLPVQDRTSQLPSGFPINYILSGGILTLHFKEKFLNLTIEISFNHVLSIPKTNIEIYRFIIFTLTSMGVRHIE